MADVKKYLKGDTTGDEQVAEDDSSQEDNTGRITELQGRPFHLDLTPLFSHFYIVSLNSDNLNSLLTQNKFPFP